MNSQAIKSRWTYSVKPHPKLDIRYAYRKNNIGIEVMTEDKVHYNEKEIRLLQKTGGTNKDIHTVKNIFKGVIVQ